MLYIHMYKIHVYCICYINHVSFKAINNEIRIKSSYFCSIYFIAEDLLIGSRLT